MRILTHFESDYGAAPKVEMQVGQKVTNVDRRLQGRSATWACAARSSAPRSCPSAATRSTSSSPAPDQVLAERMPGFHWMTFYGDYLRETGYALKKIPIEWEVLG